MPRAYTRLRANLDRSSEFASQAARHAHRGECAKATDKLRLANRWWGKARAMARQIPKPGEPGGSETQTDRMFKMQARAHRALTHAAKRVRSCERS